jgi:hypothetical protein
MTGTKRTDQHLQLQSRRNGGGKENKTNKRRAGRTALPSVICPASLTNGGGGGSPCWQWGRLLALYKVPWWHTGILIYQCLYNFKVIAYDYKAVRTRISLMEGSTAIFAESHDFAMKRSAFPYNPRSNLFPEVFTATDINSVAKYWNIKRQVRDVIPTRTQ